MKIPFVMKGSNKSNIFNEELLDVNFKIKTVNLLNIIKKMTEKKEIKLIKASESEKYYKNKKKI